MSQPAKSGGTLYQAVIDGVVSRIVSGALPPGAMLPAEPDLGAEYGVSQGTARKALIELERRGIVERRQGRGTFVAVRTPESALFHFFRLRKPDGGQVAPALEEQSVRRRKARAAERDALHGAPEQVFEILRVRSLEGRRALHETSVVPAALFPGLGDRTPPNALYAFYQQAYGVAIVRADERLAVGAAGAAGAALGVPAQTPALIVRRRAIDMADRVVELRDSVCLTEGYTYNVSLAASTSPLP